MSKGKALPPGFTVNSEIAAEMRERLEDGMLSCARAHGIARKLKVSPELIGHTADALDIRLSKCQLGLFGYPNKTGWEKAGIPEKPIPDDFAADLQSTASGQDEITCLALWEKAAEYGVSRMQAGYITEYVGLHIVHCQLGAF
jgi:hypothetical protein